MKFNFDSLYLSEKACGISYNRMYVISIYSSSPLSNSKYQSVSPDKILRNGTSVNCVQHQQSSIFLK